MLDQDVRFELDRVVRVRARALDLTMAMLGNQQGRCGQGDSGEEADSRADELGMGACLARGHGRNVVHRIPKPLRISADPNSPPWPLPGAAWFQGARVARHVGYRNPKNKHLLGAVWSRVAGHSPGAENQPNGETTPPPDCGWGA